MPESKFMALNQTLLFKKAVHVCFVGKPRCFSSTDRVVRIFTYISILLNELAQKEENRRRALISNRSKDQLLLLSSGLWRWRQQGPRNCCPSPVGQVNSCWSTLTDYCHILDPHNTCNQFFHFFRFFQFMLYHSWSEAIKTGCRCSIYNSDF